MVDIVNHFHKSQLVKELQITHQSIRTQLTSIIRDIQI